MNFQSIIESKVFYETNLCEWNVSSKSDTHYEPLRGAQDRLPGPQEEQSSPEEKTYGDPLQTNKQPVDFLQFQQANMYS